MRKFPVKNSSIQKNLYEKFLSINIFLGLVLKVVND